INNHTATVCGLALLVHALLPTRQHKALVLDGTGPQQYFPVILAGEQRKRSRHEYEFSTAICKLPIHFGEADVVADGESGSMALDVAGHHLAAGSDGATLQRIHPAGNLDIVQMQLAVTGSLIAFTIKQEAGVVGSRLICDVLMDRPGQQPDA